MKYPCDPCKRSTQLCRQVSGKRPWSFTLLLKVLGRNSRKTMTSGDEQSIYFSIYPFVSFWIADRVPCDCLTLTLSMCWIDTRKSCLCSCAASLQDGLTHVSYPEGWRSCRGYVNTRFADLVPSHLHTNCNHVWSTSWLNGIILCYRKQWRSCSRYCCSLFTVPTAAGDGGRDLR